MLQRVFDWLVALPASLLYLALGGVSAAENFFPPLPADTIVAFGAFLAARGAASPVGAFLATWVGNVGGALLMYYLGRRFGPARLRGRFPGIGDRGTAGRIAQLYARYGVPALFVSRFLPGARALVPPVAGALHVPPLSAALAMALASAVWYGTIAALAYHVGARWDRLSEMIASFGRWSAVAAVAIVVVAVTVVWLRRRRARDARGASET
ncbi:MAG TPA: DedA family protein [Gemmatimonadaceae bacterium]|nr:DedA family protein [Gemmatimonadaceae bacterium]